MLENWIYFCALPAAAGFILDLIFGDPKSIPHPVVIIGRLISFFEKRLLASAGRGEVSCRRKKVKESSEKDAGGGRSGAPGEENAGGTAAGGGESDEKTDENAADGRRSPERKKIRRRQFVSGCVTAVSVVLLSVMLPAAAVWLFCRISRAAGIVSASLLCWQMYAAKGLRKESMKVWTALRSQDVEGARYAVSMIVGRDTSVLDEKGILKAAVETVAENTSDGVIAPMFYMALAGPAGAYFYKAVNTMDSMIGYRSEKYEYFGKCAAKMDDALNFLPSRISGLLIVAAAAFLPRERKTGFRGSGKNALRIFLRDRKKHASPNSAQTESACAGALGIQLAGPAVYFRILHEKPKIGDSLRAPEYDDIRRANRLMYAASCSAVGILLAIAAALTMIFII